jgi:hypothetical protein
MGIAVLSAKDVLWAALAFVRYASEKAIAIGDGNGDWPPAGPGGSGGLNRLHD